MKDAVVSVIRAALATVRQRAKLNSRRSSLNPSRRKARRVLSGSRSAGLGACDSSQAPTTVSTTNPARISQRRFMLACQRLASKIATAAAGGQRLTRGLAWQHLAHHPASRQCQRTATVPGTPQSRVNSTRRTGLPHNPIPLEAGLGQQSDPMLSLLIRNENIT